MTEITGNEPVNSFHMPSDERSGFSPETVFGETIFQDFAGRAMQGLASSMFQNGQFIMSEEQVAQTAIRIAQYMIIELNKPKN